MAARDTMLTLKAGTLMSDRATGRRAEWTTRSGKRAGAFTFVEVIVALAIASIALLSLLKLHLLSIRCVDKAQITTQAVLLANEKIAETLAAGYPDEGLKSGTVEKNGLTLNWRTEVIDLQLPQLDQARVTGLRKVMVDVDWGRGATGRRLQMSTCVADGTLP
ncbi:MAG: prepilin-type N-terminal cleavage/methylation domain-containing protein [Phycisphaerales bacterium]|nr:MAG: prepilin-type N-terminal cleavage/methylation domain-containing protein [Phycisphaerales bacterium]